MEEDETLGTKTLCVFLVIMQSLCGKMSISPHIISGGESGRAETVTLLDNNVNKDYVYIIAVEDYRFQASGTLFLESGASISITNGVKTEDKRMVANTVNSDEQ